MATGFFLCLFWAIYPLVYPLQIFYHIYPLETLLMNASIRAALACFIWSVT